MVLVNRDFGFGGCCLLHCISDFSSLLCCRQTKFRPQEFSVFYIDDDDDDS